jgi:hypothetical protein
MTELASAAAALLRVNQLTHHRYDSYIRVHWVPGWRWFAYKNIETYPVIGQDP